MTPGPDILSSTCAIVLNWRDAPSTERCVRSLLTVFSPAQVIVVDNASDGDLRRMLEPYAADGLTLIEHPENRGYAAGMNSGIRAALSSGYQFVCAVNNDTELTADEMQPLFSDVTWAAHVGMVAPMLTDDDGTAVSALGVVNPWTMSVSSTTDSSTPFSYLTWAFIMIRTDMLRAVGLLDERFFMYWEDVEFALRARRHGYIGSVCTDVRVLHRRSASHSKAGPRIDRYQALGAVVLARTLGGIWIIGCVVRIVARVGKRVTVRDFSRAREVVCGTWDGMTVQGPAYVTLSRRRGRP